MLGAIKRRLRVWLLKDELNYPTEKYYNDSSVGASMSITHGLHRDPIVIKIWDAIGGTIVECKFPDNSQSGTLLKSTSDYVPPSLHIVRDTETIGEAIERITTFERLKH